MGVNTQTKNLMHRAFDWPEEVHAKNHHGVIFGRIYKKKLKFSDLLLISWSFIMVNMEKAIDLSAILVF